MDRPEDIKLSIPENAFTYDNYLAYLESKKWAELRNWRLKLDDYKCAICGNPHSLEVHHLLYPTVLGTESINHIVTLCKNCHQIVEKRKSASIYRKYNWYDSIELKITCSKSDFHRIKNEISSFLKNKNDGEYTLRIEWFNPEERDGECEYFYSVRLVDFREFVEMHPDLKAYFAVRR